MHLQRIAILAALATSICGATLPAYAEKTTILQSVSAKDFKGPVPNKVIAMAQGSDKATPALLRVVKLTGGTAYWFQKETRIAPTGIFESGSGDVSAIDLKTTSGWKR